MDAASPGNPIGVDRDALENSILIGRSKPMQRLYDHMARVARTDLTVLLLGEAGTGKELVARALHMYSERLERPFISINPTLIAPDLIDSELFGHRKGAIPIANRNYRGQLRAADGGTLFFDEIGDLSLETQRRIVRVIRTGEVKPLGGDRIANIDVRIIAASNYDLQRRIDEGLFREDLYTAVNIVPISLPPLRKRREDIGDLTSHFLTKLSADTDEAVVRLTDGAIQRLYDYHWPGNVRELENLIGRLWVQSLDGRITALQIDRVLSQQAPPMVPDQTLNIRQSLQLHLDSFFDQLGGDLPPDGLYQRLLKELEIPLIERVLKATSGNKIKAAKVLGLNRNTLHKRIKDLGIKSPKS